MIDSERLASLEADLNRFDPQARPRALAELLSLAEKGEIPLEPALDVCNMHCHTFFSFNAYGHSPSSLAWLGKRRGYPRMGIVDFDVLDGVDEFLQASTLAGVKGTAGIETRVFIPEFASHEINSPGEPGIAYHMGIGFTTGRVPDSAAPLLASLRNRAAQRNRTVVERVNAYLAPVEIDYEEDVLPLTPAGTATERHIVVAYIQKVGRQVKNPAAFWAEKLQIALEQAQTLLQDSPKLQNQVRSKLMKRGGVGYVNPTPEMFPTVEEFHKLIQACQALPCAAWLDGTSEGEKAIDELLELLIGKGVEALNVVPDRNWNIPDPKVKALKVQNLYDIVQLARQMDLPINAGTEMNSFGNRLVDDFNAPELAPVKPNIIDGAHFVYGHTALQRVKGLGSGSEWARSCLPTRKERNRFFTRVGCLLPPGQAGLDRLRALDPEMSPDDITAMIEEF